MAKQLVGHVTSNKTDKTIVVNVNTRKTHPIYKKQYIVGKKFLAHDEKNEAEVGDRVIISESKPISARKHHVLTEIVRKPKLSVESLAAIKHEEVDTHASKSKKSADEEVVETTEKVVVEKTVKTKTEKAK